MAAYNRVILMGNVTRDPALTYTAGGVGICEFGLAVNDRWKDKAGNQQEYVSYFDCKSFGKTGELINQYIRKGSPIHIEGKLRQGRWNDKEGNPRSRVEVNVDGFQFIGNKAEAKPSGGNGPVPDDGPPPSADADIPF